MLLLSCVFWSIQVGHVQDVVVDEKYRGQGLGKALVLCLKLLVLNQGAYKMDLDCADDKISFYKSLGFTQESGRANYLACRFEKKMQVWIFFNIQLRNVHCLLQFQLTMVENFWHLSLWVINNDPGSQRIKQFLHFDYWLWEGDTIKCSQVMRKFVWKRIFQECLHQIHKAQWDWVKLRARGMLKSWRTQRAEEFRSCLLMLRNLIHYQGESYGID